MGLSAAGGVLSTQSMLYLFLFCILLRSFAIGMGAGAVPMAAALNWVLKDGLGQLGGMAFTAYKSPRLFPLVSSTAVWTRIPAAGASSPRGCWRSRRGWK